MMLDRQPPYYLPITQASVAAYLSLGEVPVLVVERAALYAMLLACQDGGADRGKLARSVADADQAFSSISAEQVVAFLQERRTDIRHATVAALEEALQARGILFANEEQLASRAWCSGTGRYTEAFQDYCRNTLIDYEITVEAEDDEADDDDEEKAPAVRQRISARGTSDQVRAALAVSRALDEHFDLTALAGTGKTHLTLTLASTGKQFTHLAPTRHQQYAFSVRNNSTNIRSMTQRDLAQSMVADLYRLRGMRGRPPRVYESTLSAYRQAEMAAVPSIGGERPMGVLTRVLTAIRSWCYSDEPAITPALFRNIPPSDQAAYAALADRLWDLMFQPIAAQGEQIFTVRVYHVIKWLDGVGADIPATLGTILVDEAHDLQSPWRSLLDRYQGGWVVMGDPYQCLNPGSAPKSPRAKALSMFQSVRTGEQAMPLVRSVLDLHSERLVGDALQGSREHVTRRVPYGKTDALPDKGLRVYGTEWRMLEDALRLKASGAAFRLIPASAQQLKRSAMEAINLRRYGDTPRQFHLRGFKSWDVLAEHLRSIGQMKVAQLFERDFGAEHLTKLLDAQTLEGEVSITLGLLEHCKSLESRIVVMSDCCFTPANIAAHKGCDTLVKAVYVAMTRVTDELWLPGDAMDRLVDQVRTGVIA